MAGLMVLIDRLESEHVEVHHALDELGSVARGDGEGLCRALEAGDEILGKGLDDHSRDEDDDLFPRIGAMIGDAMVSVFAQEHVRIRSLRDQVYDSMRQGVADFDRCAELCDLLGDHMDREDHALFPSARSVLAE
jgi:hemerythrin-like domain-containing protein